MKYFLKVIGLGLVLAGFIWAAASFYLFTKERSIISNKKALFRDDSKERINIMKISSSAFGANQMIPAKYTCDGENINPPLQVFDIPKNAESLVLIVDDPDAPVGTWTHWTIWNIAPNIKGISENSIPNQAPWDPNSPVMPLPATEGLTDFGKPGYGGPCPPSGTHRYFFKLYALDTILDLPLEAKASDIEKMMSGHILDKAEVIGLYKRQ